MPITGRCTRSGLRPGRARCRRSAPPADPGWLRGCGRDLDAFQIPQSRLWVFRPDVGGHRTLIARGPCEGPEISLPSDREEEAILESPEAVADEMSEATERLRDQAWMIAPLTRAPIE